jgi:hypothetical protein
MYFKIVVARLNFFIILALIDLLTVNDILTIIS